LQIDVWKEPELSMGVTVRPDGMITLPLVNDIHAAGLTTKDLQDLLTQQLKPYVNEPQVTVILRDIRSRKVFLVGKVGRPGPYLLNGHKTALELIVEGGGLAQFAKGGSIYLIRNRDGRETRMHFNYKRALSGKDQKADIELLPGDMIVVP
jgi:polysaccharide biosynthesis/export protein